MTLCFLALCASVGSKRFQHCLMHGVTMKFIMRLVALCVCRNKRTFEPFVHSFDVKTVICNDGVRDF